MIGLVLAAVLAADAGTELDAGFEPVIYSVHHGEAYLDAPDGGFKSPPILLPSSVCMDEPTAKWVGKNKATSRGEASVDPTPIMLQMAGVAFAIGMLAGGALVAIFK